MVPAHVVWYCGQEFVLDFSPFDAWQLAHGETAMRMNVYLDSDEELMPNFYDSDSPDSEDDTILNN
jgi:hypothetical protein